MIINAKSKSELNIFEELAKRLGLKSKVLSQEEMEEIGLLKAM
jgi:hypothetical protein